MHKRFPEDSEFQGSRPCIGDQVGVLETPVIKPGGSEVFNRKWFEGALKSLPIVAALLGACVPNTSDYTRQGETPEESPVDDATAGAEPTATPEPPTAEPTDAPSTPEPTPEPTDEPGTGVPIDDLDGDGYIVTDDCDDSDPDVHPDASEDCDGVDDDCDGKVDEGVKTTFYDDEDGDGFGDSDSAVQACDEPQGFEDVVTVGGDCDNSDPDVNPGANEDCDDGVDTDCDGEDDVDDEDCQVCDPFDDPDCEPTDDDGDGFDEDDGDCDDNDPDVNPDATEVCDGVDNDCQGGADEGFDDDGDGFTTCDEPVEDCDDGDDEVYPGASELCDSVDNDCDGLEDEGCGDDIPDDLGEGLDWLRVDENAVGLDFTVVFDGHIAKVDPDLVVVTGTGVEGDWSYNKDFLVDYDSATDFLWFEFWDGTFRVTWLGFEDDDLDNTLDSGEDLIYAYYPHLCSATSTTSSLCHENNDGTWALCFLVDDGEVQAPSTSDCESLEKAAPAQPREFVIAN